MTFKCCELGWAAGLFEGEGCIWATRQGARTRRVGMKLVSTDFDVVQRFHAVVGFGTVYGPKFRNLTDKPYWEFTTTTFEQSQQMIAMFWSWFGVRRKERASELLRGYVADRREARMAFRCPRLSDIQVADLRRRVAAGESQSSIARDLGISQTAVSRIARGKRRRVVA